MTAILTVNDEYASAAKLYVPWSGCWQLEVFFDREVTLSGRVAARMGDLELAGTVRPSGSGRVALSSYLTLTGGAGWATPLPKKGSHSDSGLSASKIAREAAAACGETITSLDAALDRTVGVDWARRGNVPASRTLELLFPDAWYVSEDGTTKIGARPTRDSTGKLTIIEASPQGQWVRAYVSDVRDVLPGATFTDERLSAPFEVRELEVETKGQSLIATMWSGDGGNHAMVSLLRRLVEQALPWARYGLFYRYRVLDMVGARATLQAVSRAHAMPDLVAIDLAPGMAGLSAELTPGAIVLVSFVEGDPALPMITHFERPGQPGFLPVELALDASGTVKIGDSATAVELGGEVTIPPGQALTDRRFIRYGDSVIFGPPGPGVLTPVGATPPLTPTPTFSTVKP
jgi:hypothetical protein